MSRRRQEPKRSSQKNSGAQTTVTLEQEREPKNRNSLALTFSYYQYFTRMRAPQDNADIALGGMVLAHGTANIADQVFGWHPRGGAAALEGYALAG
jgi:hypothetical protein